SCTDSRPCVVCLTRIRRTANKPRSCRWNSAVLVSAVMQCLRERIDDLPQFHRLLQPYYAFELVGNDVLVIAGKEDEANATFAQRPHQLEARPSSEIDIEDRSGGDGILDSVFRRLFVRARP